MRIYITIDFECVNTRGSWLCYSVLASSYPAGNVVYQCDGACVRSPDEYDDRTAAFWEKHPVAKKAIDNMSALPVKAAEALLCDRIVALLKRFPDAYFVSDNPQYDIRIVDNILTTRGFGKISDRRQNTYRQTICTWSFQLSVLSVYNYRLSDLPLLLAQSGHASPPRAIKRLAVGVHHCPNADCARILANHFMVLDWLAMLRETVSQNPRTNFSPY